MVTGIPVLAARGVYKRFPGSLALSDVTVEFPVGNVTALVGENGAGKSTLMRILAGLDRPDSGIVERAGVAVDLTETATLNHGIALIPQEINLALALTATENILINHEPNAGLLVNSQKERETVKTLMERVGFSVPLDIPTRHLDVAQQRIVEILRALSRDADIIIMDEAIVSLGFEAARTLRVTTRALVATGKTVIYVSHYLDEVLAIADQIIVLRDGQVVAIRTPSETDSAELTELMLGRPLSKFITKKKNFHPGKQIAKVSNLSKTRCYSNVNFELRCGEIVGITGLVGSGVSHVVRSLAGVNRSDSGHILVDGIAPKNGSLKAHIDAGVALVPGDRKAEGLLLEKSVSWNISLPSIAMTRPRVIINLTWMHTTAQTVMTRLKIKAPHPATLVRNLSGGNQQKIVIGRWLMSDPKILILDEPTRGIDVGAKEEIFGVIRTFAEEGKVVLYASSEFAEIATVCDRVLVMSHGHIIAQLQGDDMNEHNILLAAYEQKRIENADEC